MRTSCWWKYRCGSTRTPSILWRRQGRRHRIEGVLVEPQRYFHQQLVRNYAGLGGFEIVNLAISDSARSMTLYHVDYDNTAVPGWAKGLGSFSRDVLMSHAHLIPDLESVIRSVEVQCISVGDLAAMAGERELDVLITDTEGHDYVILGQFDFARIRPKLVVFESKHLSAGDLSACEAMLAGHGYQVVHLGNDNSVALRGDIAEATQRAVAAA